MKNNLPKRGECGKMKVREMRTGMVAPYNLNGHALGGYGRFCLPLSWPRLSQAVPTKIGDFFCTGGL